MGGWRDTSTLLRYEQPDEATMRKVAAFERPPERSPTPDQAVSNSPSYSHTLANRRSCPWGRRARRRETPAPGTARRAHRRGVAAAGQLPTSRLSGVMVVNGQSPAGCCRS